MNGDSPERECQKEGCINTRKNLLNHIDRTRQQNSQLERFSKVSEEVQTLKMKLVETKACLESTSLKMQELTNAKEIAEAELKQLQSASEVDKRRILILQGEADEAEKHKETANYWREKYDSMGALAEKLEENNEEIKGKYEKTVRTMELLGKRTIALQDKLAKLKLAKGEGDGRHKKIEKYLESAIEVIDALSSPSNLSKLPKSISDKVNVFRRDDVRLHFNSMPWTASGPSEDVATNSEAHLSDDDEDDDDVEHLEQLLAQKIQKSPPKRRQKPRVVNSEDVPPEKWPRGIRKPTLEDSGGILDSRKVHSKRIVTSDFDVIAEATERRKKALKVGGANVEDSGASANSGATIHGKKGKSVRETQSEMMKGETIKEKVARMRKEKEMPPIPVQSTSTAEKPAKTKTPPNPAESSKTPGAPEIRKSRTYNLSERSSDGESIGRRRRISEISDFSPETPQPLRRSGRLASQPSTPARTKNSKSEMPSMPPPSTRKSQSVRTRSTSQMEAATCSHVQDSDDVQNSVDRAAAGAEMIVPEVVVLDSEVLEISEIQISQTPTSSEVVHVAPEVSEDVTIEISTSKDSEDVTKKSTPSESSNVEISTSQDSEDVPNDYSPVLSDSEDVEPQNSAPECSTSSAESTAPPKNSEDVNLKIPKSPKQLIVSKYGLDISDSEEEDLEEAPPTSGPSISEAPPTSVPLTAEAPPLSGSLLPEAPPTSGPSTAEAPPTSGPLVPETPPTSESSTAEAPPTEKSVQSQATPPQKAPPTDNFFDDILSGARSSASSSSSTTAPPTSGSLIAETPPKSSKAPPTLEASSPVKSAQAKATPPPVSTTVPPQAPPPILKSRSQKAPPTQAPPTTDNFFDDILSGARSSASSSTTAATAKKQAPPTKSRNPEAPPTKSKNPEAPPTSSEAPLTSKSKAPPTSGPLVSEAPPTSGPLIAEAPPTSSEAPLTSKSKAPPASGPLVAEATPTSSEAPPTKSKTAKAPSTKLEPIEVSEAPPTKSKAPKAPPTSSEATPTFKKRSQSVKTPPTKSDAQPTSSEAPPTSPDSESDDTDEAPPTFKRRTSRILKVTPTSSEASPTFKSKPTEVSEAPPTKPKAPKAPPTSSEAMPTFKKISQSVKAPPTKAANTEAPPTISDDQRTSKSMAPPTSGPLIAEAPPTSSNAPPTSPTSESDDADEAPPTFKRRTSRISKATPTSSEAPRTKSEAPEATPTSKSKPKEVSEAPPIKSKAPEAPPTSKSKPTKVSESPPSSSDSESDDSEEAPPIFKRRTSRMSKATPTSSDAPPTKSKALEAPPPTLKKRLQSVKAPPTSSGSDDILDDIISGARNSVKPVKKQAPPTKQKVSETPSTSSKAPPTQKAPPTTAKAPPTKRKTSSEDEQPAKRGKTTSEEEPTTTTTSKILKGPKSAIMIEAPPLKRGRPPKVKLPVVMEKGTKKIGVLKAHFRQALDLKVEVNILAQKMKEKGIILGDSIPLQPADAVDVMMEFLRQTSAGDTWAALIRQLDQNLVPLKNTEEENFLQVSCSLNEDSDTLLELFIERILCEISFRDSMDSKQTCRLARLFCHAVFFSRKSLEDSDESSDDVIVKKSTWIRQFLRIIFLKNAANLAKSVAFCLISDAGKYCRWIGDEIMENGESEFNFPFRILMHKDPEQATVINKILNSKFEVAYIAPPTKEDVITKFREIHRKFVDDDEFSMDSSIFMSKTAEAECLEVAFDFLKIEMNRIEKQFIDPKNRGEKLKHKTVFSLPTVATKMTLEEAESLKKEMKWQKTVLLVMIDNSMTDHWKAIMKALREISPNIVALREIVESSEIDQFAESTALEPLREAVEHISDLISKFTNFPLLSKN